MAQLNSLLVTGNSRFLNPINGNARNGVYYVKGTQTAATGSWTGTIQVPALYDGLTIMYYLPYAGSGNATLNLTLSNGTTTGAINCYYSTSRLTTHYSQGSNIVMTYHPAGSISINGTATTDNRWIANANYDSNSDQNAMYIRYYNNVLAKEALTAEKIIVGGYDGYQVATSGITFNLSYPIIWTTAAVAKGSSNYANMYSQIYDRKLTNVKSGFASTANKAIYLIVTVSGLTATVDSNILTDTLPSTEDGKVYIYLGKLGAQSTGANYFIFEPVHPMFWYKNGKIVPFAPEASNATTVNGHTVASNVPANAVFTDTTYTGTGLISVDASTHVISTTAQANVQSDWNATSGDAFIKNKPTIPTVNNATLTIQKNGSTVKTFTANASSNVTCNITVPTATSDLTNDSSFCAINDNASSLTSTFSSSKITDMLTPWYSFEYLDTSTNCANITYVAKPPNIDVATAGVYLCIAHVHFKQNGNGVRELRIVQSRDGTQVGISTGTTGPASNVGEAALCESYIFTANAGDRFSLQLYQSSGGTLAATFRQLQVYRLSPILMS